MRNSTRSPYLDLLCEISCIDLDPAKADLLAPAIEGVDNWQQFLAQTELYAISNLLLRHAKAHEWVMPNNSLMSLRALSLRHRHAADARYEVLLELSEAFEQHKLPFVALKGLALAPMVYPQDELRPMRDIDILVPRGKTRDAGNILREIGFDLPEDQPTKFMRDSHQLPNATKKVNGFTVSVEIHHDALSRDLPGSLFYHQVEDSLQQVQWRDLKFHTLGHELMLHQVARHLATLHPGAVLKMINVLDVVLYAEKFQQEIDWQLLQKRYPHVGNTLKCLHLIVPLSASLQELIGGVHEVELKGVGETMRPLSLIFTPQNSLKSKLKMLFMPPDWWLHLYYNVSPNKSLFWVLCVKHPMQVVTWLLKRAHSGLLGG